MRLSNKVAAGFCAVMTLLATLADVQAQVRPSRNSRTGPAAGLNVPKLSLSTPTLTFGGGFTGLNPLNNSVYPDLNSEDADQVAEAHNWARQQTLLCLMYLRANKEAILSGNDPMYNSVFGQYYDRTNPHFGTYVLDESHYNQVLNTFTTMQNLLESPTFYNFGSGGNTTYGSVFGYDRGLRQWGYSTSSSRDNLDGIVTPYTDSVTFADGSVAANVNPGAAVFPPLRWDADDSAFRLDATGDSLSQRIANNVDRAFFNEKLDIYGSADNADRVSLNDLPSQQFVGNLFFYDPDTTDFYRRMGERRSVDAAGNLIENPYQNGEIEFTVDRFGRILINDTLGGRFSGFQLQQSAGRFNSNEDFQLFDDDGDGLLDMDPANDALPLATFDRYPNNAFSAPQFRQFQMLMMSFAEFTTVLGDSRGGAFVGISGILSVLDPSGRAGAVYGGSLDARAYAMFSDFLNGAGITDPRRFPPSGKNVQAFTPAIPSS
jgi:hypothetical protein